MVKLKEISGRTFGKLTVLSMSRVKTYPKGYKEPFWHCLCECGTTCERSGHSLTKGKVKSCGCLRVQNAISVGFKHGLRKHPLYSTWLNMKGRCYNPKNRQYKDYGGRGVRVCDRWLKSFQNFLKDMGECPDKMSLDREDNDGNYTPDNCRWATKQTQNFNKRIAGTSQYVGVSWDKRKLAWRAVFKRKHLGYTKDEKEAALIYDKAVREVLGEYATTNF